MWLFQKWSVISLKCVISQSSLPCFGGCGTGFICWEQIAENNILALRHQFKQHAAKRQLQLLMGFHSPDMCLKGLTTVTCSFQALPMWQSLPGHCSKTSLELSVWNSIYIFPQKQWLQAFLDGEQKLIELKDIWNMEHWQLKASKRN